MGGKGGKKKKRPQVQHAPLLDYGQLMRQANESAAVAAREQTRAQIEAYPQLEALQLGTIQKIADNLNNQYTRDAMAGVNRTVGDAATIRGVGADMRGTAGEMLGIGRMLRDQAGETNIERMLREQAEGDLALGRSLNAAETRDAQQSARAAFAARGLGASMPSSAAEILNRDAMAQAREASRRNFAAATNQMVTGNVTGRFGQAAGILGSGAQVQQGAANAFAQGAQIDANAAQMRANLDPYQRALGNAAIGSQLGGNLMQGIGQTYSNAQQGVLGAATFNVNAIDSRNNAAMNNWAAMNAARMQAGALNQQGTMGMIGGIGQGLLQGAGMALAFSDKRMKKEIKPLGKSGSVLGLKMYSYKYRGDDKQRIGVMAQDVQKVLPEAVEEVDYKGKKRLAIKPAVIGAALAEELAAQAA